MGTLRLIGIALRHHWDAQKSNRANLIAGTFGMVLNNVIVLWGLWVMLFYGKPNGRELTVYFLALNATVTIAWGLVSFVLGGTRSLAETIDEGALEPMLATPRDPLLLAAISQSLLPNLGDIVQGSLNLIALFFIGSPWMATRCLFFVFVSATAFLGLFILCGSIPFFVRRGSALSQLLIETNLSLSFYPTGKIFTDRGRFLLYLTPAAATGVLPMNAIESGGWQAGLIAAMAAAGLFWLAVRVFRLGLRRYQSSSYVIARG